MEQVIEFFQKLFETSDWPPRWHRGNWTAFYSWFYIVSDLLIWSAYFAIPIVILKYIAKRVDVKFTRVYFLFAAFILACGSTHLLDAIAFWFPAYRLNALVRFFTGVISWATVIYLIKILPLASSLQSHGELEKEIAERKKIEEELKISNQLLNAVQEIAKLGHWEWDVKADKISWSNELYKIYGLQRDGEISYDLYLSRLHPEDKDFVNNAVQQALQAKSFPSFTHRLLLSDGSEKIIQSRGDVITDSEGNVVKMIGTAQDITEIKKAQQQLEERTHALEVTNQELQRYAYVASHDLQEPLRKIMTFASLLEKELGDTVNENEKMYLEKIVQSSGRMQRLIDDILSFSGLRMTTEVFVPTDLNAVLKQALSDIEVSIEATGAIIRAATLPSIEAIPSQMEQLFQNLIANAIKFRKEGQSPVVTITCRIVPADELLTPNDKNNSQWMAAGSAYNWSREHVVQINITDNGIGFDEAYTEKIFEIFQRLHSNKTYKGTGIGLAICKKIVDNHHGTIIAKGEPGTGATFTVALPLSQKNFAKRKATPVV